MTTQRDPMAVEQRENSFALPRWPWLLVPAVLLFAAALVLQIWLPGYHQRAAIRVIEEARGRVVIEPGGPKRLRDRIGDERMAPLFDRVVEVNLDGREFNDLWMPVLSPITRLRRINLSGTQVTDAGLVHLWRAHE